MTHPSQSPDCELEIAVKTVSCLQYKNVRPDYLKNIWKVVNWSDVANRYEKAS